VSRAISEKRVFQPGNQTSGPDHVSP
jgi:hypothetical protein